MKLGLSVWGRGVGERARGSQAASLTGQGSQGWERPGAVGGGAVRLEEEP